MRLAHGTTFSHQSRVAHQDGQYWKFPLRSYKLALRTMEIPRPLFVVTKNLTVANYGDFFTESRDR